MNRLVGYKMARREIQDCHSGRGRDTELLIICNCSQGTAYAHEQAVLHSTSMLRQPARAHLRYPASNSEAVSYSYGG